jgi:hypothetical protein
MLPVDLYTGLEDLITVRVEMRSVSVIAFGAQEEAVPHFPHAGEAPWSRRAGRRAALAVRRRLCRRSV